MSGRIGIILLCILNIATFILDFFIFWLILYVFALSDGPTSPSYYEILLLVGIGFEVLKWVAFYYIVKYKYRIWLVFYGVYAGGMLILFFLGFHYHLLLLSSLLYFVSIVLVANETKYVKVKNDKGKALKKAKEGENRWKDFSRAFRIALSFFFLPVLYLSYLVSMDWYYFSLDERLFRTSFFIWLFIQTLILVLSWFMLLHLWKNGNSNGRYLFMLPISYHIYATIRSSNLLMEVLEIRISDLVFYPAIHLNIGAVILYTIGLIILHREGKNWE